jgi:hypothetical protein
MFQDTVTEEWDKHLLSGWYPVMEAGKYLF